MQPFGDHAHAGMVDVGVGRARLRGFEPGLLRVEHSLVQLLLEIGELAVRRERARDVGGVQRIDFHAGVDEQQLAIVHGARVADPMQNRRMGTRGDDCVIADLVAFLARNRIECAFENAFGAWLAQCARQLLENVVEAVLGGVDGTANLAHLEVILLHARFGGEFVQLVVAHRIVCLIRETMPLAQLVHDGRDLRIRLANHAQLHGAVLSADVLAEHVVQLGDVVCFNAGHRLELLQSSARADPVLAVVWVLEEVLCVVVCTRGHEQHRRMRAVLVRVEHEHRARLVVLAETGVIGERGIRAERVVAVIVAHLRLACRNHQTFAGERLAQHLESCRNVGGGFKAFDLGLVVVPTAAHEVHERIGTRAQRTVVHTVVHWLIVAGCRRLLTRLVFLVLLGDYFAHCCSFLHCLGMRYPLPNMVVAGANLFVVHSRPPVSATEHSVRSTLFAD